MMKYQIIQNKSTSTKFIFNTYLEGAEIIYIASAFIDDFSIKFLHEILALPKSERPQIKFLTGLFGRFNSKKNLLALQQLNENINIEIKISVEPKFHWKYYSFKHSNVFTFLIGSSNFTENGFNSEGEFLFRFTEQVKSSESSKLYSMFSKEFEDAKNIREFNLDEYVERKKLVDISNDKKIVDLLNKLKLKEVTKPEPSKLCRILKFQFPISAKVRKELYEQKSIWQKKKWEPFVFKYKVDYEAARKSKYILNIHRTNGEYYMELNEIMGNEYLPIGDEHYFIATVSIKNLKLTNLKKEELDNINFAFKTQPNKWKDMYSTKVQNELIRKWFKI